MEINQVGPLPKPLRRAILFLLLITTVVSFGLSIFFATVSPNTDLTIVSMGAAQAALTGLVVTSIVFFTVRMKDTDDVQKIIDDFFIDDVMIALKNIDGPAPLMIEYRDAKTFRRGNAKFKSRSRLQTDYVAGRDFAGFIVENGRGEKIEMYLKVNVRHVTVKYFFDPSEFDGADDDKYFKSAFAQSINGAESVGYSTKLIRRFHASMGKEVLELTLHMHGGADMLMNPAERLFFRNDFKNMTASMLHTLEGVRMQETKAKLTSKN